MSVRYPVSGEAVAGSPGVLDAGGAVLNDPTRPALTGWRWLGKAGGLRPLTGSALGGGGVTERPAQGGLLAIAEPDVAAARIEAWWSGSPYLRVQRLLPDGSLTPVRDGYPLSVRSVTRRNRCSDPSFELSTTQWLAGSNTTVAGRDDTGAAAGSRVGRITATAAGAVQAIVPCAISAADQTQVSMALRLSATPSGSFTMRAEYLDETGAVLASSSAAYASGSLAQFVAAAGAAMVRTGIFRLTPPPGAASANVYLEIAGMSAGGWADIDAVLIEDATTAGDQAGQYFDGDVLTGSWDLARQSSPSQLAGAQRIMDREVPLDVPVRYVMTAPDMPGFQAVSEPVVVESKRRVWLLHPAEDLPVQVWVSREPRQTYGIEQAVMPVLGAKHPVVVSGARRRAATGTYQIWTERFDDRATLLRMLDDGSPLLLRMPANHGHGGGEWIAIGDVDVEAIWHMALEGVRKFELPFTVCRAPALPGAA